MSIGSGCLAQAGNMKEYIKNKDLGLKSPGSSYALFRAYVRKHGKPAGFSPHQRLTSKTLVNQSLPEKWRRLTPESKAFWAEKVSQIGNKNAEHRSMLTALAQATEEKTPTDQPPSKASSHGSAEGMVFESDGQLWLAKTELGRGTYGQVFAVRNPETGHSLAATESDPLTVRRDMLRVRLGPEQPPGFAGGNGRVLIVAVAGRY